jgi:hypothetical protein
MDKDGLQKLLEHGDELKTATITTLVAKARELSISNQYVNEEVKSNYGYPKGYRVKGITEQTNILRRLISGVGFADEKLAERSLPNGAEGFFAIPRWQTVGKTYGEATEKIFALLNKQRNGNFRNWREGKLGGQYLRQSERTAAVFQKLGDEQEGYDILIVPAQFGKRHAGRSVRRVLEVMPRSSEFGLGAFAVGCMLLTHPERLIDYNDLWIDCSGDEYAPGGDGQFVNAPYFNFNGGDLKFNTNWVDNPNDNYGSASGFLSKSLLSAPIVSSRQASCRFHQWMFQARDIFCCQSLLFLSSAG